MPVSPRPGIWCERVLAVAKAVIPMPERGSAIDNDLVGDRQWPAVTSMIARLAASGEEPMTALPDGLDAGSFRAACDELGLPVRRIEDRLLWRPDTSILDAGRIGGGAGPLVANCAVTVLPLVESSNEYLKRTAVDTREASAQALFVESQWAGRGRRQRRWHGRFGQSLLMSLRVDTGRSLTELPGVSIVAGVTVARCLASLGVAGIGLKWPNDVLLDKAKVGGILVEAVTPRAGAGESLGRHGRVVIGIGLNWQSPDEAGIELDQASAGLATRLTCAREQLAGALLGDLLEAIAIFRDQGVGSFVAGFRPFDRLADRPVQIEERGSTRFGVARGLAADGALRIEHDDGVRVYHSAEVTLRAMPAAVSDEHGARCVGTDVGRGP